SMPSAKKKTVKKSASKALENAGVYHADSETQFLPEPSWTGPGANAPAAHRFRHWVCSDNNTCVPYVEQESFTDNINWRIFRIMAEFVEGFEFLSRLKKEVTIFGSARAMPDNKYYKLARALGNRLGKEGYAVITGGGPGLMEAGNRGAFEADGESIGLDIQLPTEQRRNKYVKQSKGFHYFFTRKVMLSASAQAYIFFPGGFGTLDELFEMVTLIQTGKMSDQVPVILFGKDYWEGMLEWIKKKIMDENHFIEPFELEILRVVDTVDEAFEIIRQTPERVL
ncbi:MAG: TIGR00730 family Rossman fold protein, partial [Candidatus Uhrbacteria bacterium]|nr:TIGR00730 family Rossman fold protein [Candidatus Uhrbacteria bacterium]